MIRIAITAVAYEAIAATLRCVATSEH